MKSLRTNWSLKEVMDLFEMPFGDLIFHSHHILSTHFDPNQIQISTLLSIKTGSCPEDCRYCAQSVHYKTSIEKNKLLDVETTLQRAKCAKKAGATRLCMAASGKAPVKKDFDSICEMVEDVKKMGLETCLSLGMLTLEQAKKLKESGLDYYNHNIDTSKKYYKKVITSRTFEDRLKTLENIRLAGIKICCGGIVGMGESREDRANMLLTLANMDPHPESIPINLLVKIPGTPLHNVEDLCPFELTRTIAITRILMSSSYVRLSAGRQEMSEELQALCFFAGANSIFYGEKLLTTCNQNPIKDKKLFEKLGLKGT